MATITTTKLALLVCVFALLPLAMEMMPLQPESAGTTCGVLILLVYTLWENYYFFYCQIAILRSRHMMHFGFIIKLVCCFGWFSGLSFGQVPLSDTLTGSVTLSALQITCLANLAVFYTCILKGAPKLDIGAKDLLPKDHKLKNIKDLLPKCHPLFNINGLDDQTTDQCEGLTTCQRKEPFRWGDCDVVMLSKEKPNSSMRQFMLYMSNVHNVNSLALECRPVDSVHAAGNCTCGMPCGCIVFKTGEQITKMLVCRMPGIVRGLPDSRQGNRSQRSFRVPTPLPSLCLLPCQPCLRNGCHGCNQGLLQPEESDGLSERDSQVGFQVEQWSRYVNHCICIPMRSKSNDVWTKQLITLLELQENEGRTSASSALKNYIAGSGECEAEEAYNLFWLIIVPTLTEVLINIALTFWFKVDGFSSALVARRAMKDYLPQSDGTGFSPIAFLSGARVKSNRNNSNVCQMLRFRGSRLSLRPLYLMMGCVNLICSISWIVLVALEGGANKWYHTHSMPPSEGRIIVIMVAIFIALAMDLYHLSLFSRIENTSSRKFNFSRSRKLYIPMLSGWSIFGTRYRLRVQSTSVFFKISAIIVLEILCIVSGSVVLGILGKKVCGRWLYSVLQSLVWIKWGLGNWPKKVFNFHVVDGRYMYASPFFLNAILAGVRAEWEFS